MIGRLTRNFQRRLTGLTDLKGFMALASLTTMVLSSFATGAAVTNVAKKTAQGPGAAVVAAAGAQPGGMSGGGDASGDNGVAFNSARLDGDGQTELGRGGDGADTGSLGDTLLSISSPVSGSSSFMGAGSASLTTGATSPGNTSSNTSETTSMRSSAMETSAWDNQSADTSHERLSGGGTGGRHEKHGDEHEDEDEEEDD